jgi:hypothetical protein
MAMDFLLPLQPVELAIGSWRVLMVLTGHLAVQLRITIGMASHMAMELLSLLQVVALAIGL